MEAEIKTFADENAERIERNKRRLNPDELWINQMLDEEANRAARLQEDKIGSEEVMIIFCNHQLQTSISTFWLRKKYLISKVSVKFLNGIFYKIFLFHMLIPKLIGVRVRRTYFRV